MTPLMMQQDDAWTNRFDVFFAHVTFSQLIERRVLAV